ncbi:MAG TPA: hypothetical protein VLD84_03300 [Nitrososphaeraceae archaeon]|nr:hypothetical protein [Nitrososphaeraceae archaeon]
MENDDLNYTSIFNHLIENSIFTKKQTSIIYNKILHEERAGNISAGAYYRQLGQCRKKVKRTIYTLLLLRLLNVFDPETFVILNQLNDQLNVILNKPSHEIDNSMLSNVISLMDNVIGRLVLI